MLKSFESQKYVQEIILDENGKVFGVIRIKPSGVLWKPKNAGKFYSVSLEKFIEWISDPATKANRTKS
jgi:hypothetical protein